jgi:hypothetical protein
MEFPSSRLRLSAVDIELLWLEIQTDVFILKSELRIISSIRVNPVQKYC